MQKNILFQNTRPYSEKEIADWELQFGISLPYDYKTFLTEFGKSQTFNVKIHYKEIDDYFYPNDWSGFDKSDQEILENQIKHDKGKSFYPFICDGGGVFGYISLKNDDYGTIYLNHWDKYDFEKEEYQKFKVADSFEDFINGLQTEEEVSL